MDVIDQNAPQGVHLCGEGGSWASVLRKIVFKSYLRMVARCFHEHLGGRLRVQSLSAAEGVQTVSKVCTWLRIGVFVGWFCGGGRSVSTSLHSDAPLDGFGRWAEDTARVSPAPMPRPKKSPPPPKTAPPTTPYSSRKNFIKYLFYLIFH